MGVYELKQRKATNHQKLRLLRFLCLLLFKTVSQTSAIFYFAKFVPLADLKLVSYLPGSVHEVLMFGAAGGQ